MSNKVIAVLVSMVALGLGGPARAADSAKVFGGTAVTEEALVEALTPRVRMRSIKVQREPPGEAQNAPAAHLLITFDFDSAELSVEAKGLVDKLGRALNTQPLTEFSFTVEGHADPRGTSEYNVRLSQARAESVLRYLVAQHGISERRLRAVGKGSTEPLNRAVESAPENRRVTVLTVQE
jgi:outer membrane protein OmpA-like peptidoglycan-associated protein